MKTVDEYLDEINYKDLNEGKQLHSKFTWHFIQFLRLIKKDDPKFKDIPLFHLNMLDGLTSKKRRLVNICFRGASKTSLFGIYLLIYLAVFKYIEGFGSFDYGFYVCDSKDKANALIRKNIQREIENNPTLQKYLPPKMQRFTEDSLHFTNAEGKETIIDLFGASTGIRGSVKLNTRPQIAFFDDIITDEAARSQVMMENLRDLIHASVEYALDPDRSKIVFNGTPFNKNDVLYQAVESGVWEVNAYPVCDKFPCTREEFEGAWETRFSYDVLKDKYDAAVAQGAVNRFQRELMLRITNEEDRLLPDEAIKHFSFADWDRNQSKYNYYITTDFAVSEKASADQSVITVWAVDSKGRYNLVDGMAKQQTMDKTIEDLFLFAKKYKPVGVGVENTGQQQGLISWIRKEMLARKIYFSLVRNGKSIGIRPEGDKYGRFNIIVPEITKGDIRFPDVVTSRKFFLQVRDQIKNVSIFGIKGHDDILDTISMLQYMGRPKKPSNVSAEVEKNYSKINERFGRYRRETPVYSTSSYIGK